MMKRMVLLILCLLAVWYIIERQPHLKSLWLNRQANQFLVAQNYQQSFESNVKTLALIPFAAEIHLNLGLTFEGQQQPEKALTSYQNSLKYAQSDEAKFMALFNQAQLLGKAKKIDEALELYQKALGFDPGSKETKTNIELLIQMQQQQQGGGDQKEQKDQQDQQDQQKQENSQGNQDQKDPKEPQDSDKSDKEDQKDQDKKKKPSQKPQYSPNQKYQPRPFKGQELSEGDVKKILGEIKQQEQKIRSEYNRKEVKEQPRDKDW